MPPNFKINLNLRQTPTRSPAAKRKETSPKISEQIAKLQRNFSPPTTKSIPLMLQHPIPQTLKCLALLSLATIHNFIQPSLNTCLLYTSDAADE